MARPGDTPQSFLVLPLKPVAPIRSCVSASDAGAPPRMLGACSDLLFELDEQRLAVVSPRSSSYPRATVSGRKEDGQKIRHPGAVSLQALLCAVVVSE